jgi:hypothetical protein
VEHLNVLANDNLMAARVQQNDSGSDQLMVAWMQKCLREQLSVFLIALS